MTGLKPTQTRVSRYGVMPLSFSADNVGPLVRTARDCGALPTRHRRPRPEGPDQRARAGAGLRGGADRRRHAGCGSAACETYFLDGADAPVIAAFEAALAMLKARGAEITRVKLPLMEPSPPMAARLPGRGCGDPRQLDARAPRRLRDPPHGAAVSAAMPSPAPLCRGAGRRGPMLKAFAAEMFAGFDLLVTPTMRTRLPTLAETDIDHGPPGTERRSWRSRRTPGRSTISACRPSA